MYIIVYLISTTLKLIPPLRSTKIKSVEAFTVIYFFILYLYANWYSFSHLYEATNNDPNKK